MKLPNAHLAVVEREKTVDYRLNTAHPFGASKAKFFAGFGFRVEAWEVQVAALREHGLRHEVTKVKETGFGPRYEVEFVTLTGHTVAVATVLPSQLRPVTQRDLSHVRELTPA